MACTAVTTYQCSWVNVTRPRHNRLRGEWTVKSAIISHEYAFDRQSITGITSVDSAYKVKDQRYTKEPPTTVQALFSASTSVAR